MAAATATISELQQLGGWPWGTGLRAVWAKVTLNGDYTTNGVAINKATLGFRHLHGIFVPGHDAGTDPNNHVRVNGTVTAQGNNYGYNPSIQGGHTSPKLYLSKGGMTPVEESNGTDVTDYFVYAIFVGEV